MPRLDISITTESRSRFFFLVRLPLRVSRSSVYNPPFNLFFSAISVKRWNHPRIERERIQLARLSNFDGGRSYVNVWSPIMDTDIHAYHATMDVIFRSFTIYVTDTETYNLSATGANNIVTATISSRKKYCRKLIWCINQILIPSFSFSPNFSFIEIKKYWNNPRISFC